MLASFSAVDCTLGIMGRVFCLPVFSRKHKKLEYRAGNPEELSNETPASPASHETKSVSFLEDPHVVKDPVAIADHQEASSSSCHDESHHLDLPGRIVFPEQQILEKIIFPELQPGSELEEATITVKNSSSPVAEALEEDLEAEVLAGHLSDPGLYCVEDREEFSGSCTTSECSQNKFDHQLHHPQVFDHHHQQEILGEAFVARESGDEIKVAKVALTLAAAGDETDDESSGMMKRVEEWVKSIETTGEPFVVDPPMLESSPAGPEQSHHSRANSAQRELEFANSLARSLDIHAAVAHLNGVGLAVIPCLGTFSYLKTLKLSGNSIGRITPGSLPKGLHSLDLSRNKIAVIEGLRELTRLRSLNLSYNRIQRIGQGLANCGSIRELHLACNKISEVEGLHRLVKLAYLDLSYNRLASTKSLGQIAATYTSLLLINLVGNPVMVNVGDEQVKRFLIGVAPNLVYLNGQAVKGGGSTRDAVVRSIIGSSSGGRHSPHNSSSSSKAKRILGSSGGALARPRRDPSSASASSSRPEHHHRSSKSVLKTGLVIGESSSSSQQQALARIQRVKSDGALHERDV